MEGFLTKNDVCEAKCLSLFYTLTHDHRTFETILAAKVSSAMHLAAHKRPIRCESRLAEGCNSDSGHSRSHVFTNEQNEDFVRKTGSTKA